VTGLETGGKQQFLGQCALGIGSSWSS
jgi:hypothetical protein